MAWLESLPSASVDLVVTDPPYESLEKHRAVGTTTRLKVSKSRATSGSASPNARFGALFREVFRVLRKDRHFYLFCDPRDCLYCQADRRAGRVQVLEAARVGQEADRDGLPLPLALRVHPLLEKGKRRLHNLGTADILEEQRVRNGYPTEKPVGISEVLISQSTDPGDVVADPFMGSGSVAAAATRLRRDFVGNDVSDTSLNLARERLASAGGLEQSIIERASATEARVPTSNLFVAGGGGKRRMAVDRCLRLP